MASAGPGSASPDAPITIKISSTNGDNRKFKLPLKDLGANTLPDKLRTILQIPSTAEVIFERYSDSAGAYITLDSNNQSVYKQLYRAAKAKLKLRLRATVLNDVLPTYQDSEQPRTVESRNLPKILEADHLPSHRYVPPSVETLVEEAPTLAPAPTPTKATCGQVQLPTHPTISCVKPAGGARSGFGLQSCVTPCGRPSFGNSMPLRSVEKQAEQVDATEKKKTKNEAPTLPHIYSARDHFFAEIESMSKDQPKVLRSAEQPFPVPGTSFTICCNHCDKPIPDGHWHCSICDEGDFDLCLTCVEKGILCDCEDHWLIKRSVQDGKVINSFTEKMAPKKNTKVEYEREIPGAFTEPKEESSNTADDITRTCNSCVGVFEESFLVTCSSCEDFDLCLPCHVENKHGHHPSHTFEPASKDTILDAVATKLLGAGRGMKHLAICDGCDKDIYGVRHKCMSCPDWDFCSSCIVGAGRAHPGHRFLPVYERIAMGCQRAQRHLGIHCDGPLCKGKGPTSFIEGNRYKCAVCDDTDFCANCEALPNSHNRTHPLIKFKTPVRNAVVTTYGEKDNGEPYPTMGDQPPRSSSNKSTETVPTATSTNAATQVQTVAEVKPSEPVKEELKPEPAKVVSPEVKTAVPELQAYFVHDTIADGTFMPPNFTFTQVWTLRNPGPHAWPAGCSVRFTGGDAMLNVDASRAGSTSDIIKATETNTIEHEVAPGEDVKFSVMMKTPDREGKAISYWRVKDKDGLAFGHRLWCDVDVISKSVPAYIGECYIDPFQVAKKEPETEEVKTDDVKTESVKSEDGEAVTSIKKEPSESQMIFPTLDKESPTNSTYVDSTSAPAPKATAEKDAKDTLVDDTESMGFDDSESDDAFLTDEEYEMLTASDEEFGEAPNGKKGAK